MEFIAVFISLCVILSILLQLAILSVESASVWVSRHVVHVMTLLENSDLIRDSVYVSAQGPSRHMIT